MSIKLDLWGWATCHIRGLLMHPAQRPRHRMKDRSAAKVMLLIGIIIIDVFFLLAKVELFLHSLSSFSPKCDLWHHSMT